MLDRHRGRRSVSWLLVMLLTLAGCTRAGEEENSPPSTVASTSTSEASALDLGIPAPPGMAIVGRWSVPNVEPSAGQSVSITAYVLSAEPIVRLEIWAGPEVVSSIELVTPATRVAETFQWTPRLDGIQAVLVRATDITGRTGQGFPMWVRVRPAEVDATAGGDRLVGAGLLNVLGASRSIPLIPALATEQGPDCTTVIQADGAPAAAGVAIYTATLGSTGFSVVDVLPESGGTVSVPSAPVPMLVYSEAFDAAGGVMSAPTLVPAAACAEGSWSGEVMFEGGRLTVPGGAERAYLYLSTGTRAWKRVPSGDRTFVKPGGDGTFDFSHLLPPVAQGESLIVEAWAWRRGSLVGLGRAVFSSPATGSGAVAAGTPLLPTKSGLAWVLPGGQLTTEDILCTYQAEAVTGSSVQFLPLSCANNPLGVLPSTTFRWTPAPGELTHGVWQVSAVPPPEGAQLAFAGLLGMGLVPKPVGSATVDFEIPDLAAMLAATVPSASVTGGDPLQLTYQSVLQLAGGVVSGSSSGGGTAMTFDLPSTLGGGSPGPAYGPPEIYGTLPKGLYVRVIPMDAGQPQPQVSNRVSFELIHTALPPAPPPTPPFSVNATMVPPHLPNPAYKHCVRVIENPFGSKNPAPGGMGALAFAYEQFEASAFITLNGVKVNKGLIPGATVCAKGPPPPDDDWWDVIVDAVEFVVWVWDLHADMYAFLKQKIVEGILFVTQCESVAGKEACEFVANQAVNIGLTMLGIPPTMPKFSELVEAAKGDIADWVVTAAVQAGYLNCGDTLQSTCEDVAEDVLEEFLDVVQEGVSEAAVAGAASDGYTLFLNPDIVVVPEPAGTVAPGVVELVLTRTNAPFSGTSCVIHGQVVGSTVWTWSGEDGSHIAEQVSGDAAAPMSTTVDVSGIKPGETRKLSFAFTNMTAWYLPGQSNLGYAVPKYQPKSWIFYFAPGTITMLVSSYCFSTFSQAFPQDDLPTEPGEIP
jgi:hypothetical protein